MSVASLLPEPSMDSVKQAVRSASTCCNATVLALQSLIRGTPKSSLEVESNLLKKTSRSRKVLPATSSRTRTTTKSKVSLKGVSAIITKEHDAAHLSIQEKVSLATEVFNTTLKTLADVSKSPELRVLTTSGPLCPASPNRILKSPTKSKSSQRAQLNASGTDSGIIAVAECASMALSCLRSVKAEQSGKENEPPNVQLEQGACVLVGRYLSLGLHDLAYRELRGLKRRIQQYLDSQDTTREDVAGRNNPRGADEETVKERMSDLLTFKNLTFARPLHGLIVSFQANALRLIALEQRPSTMQKVTASLQLANQSSPANLITAAAGSKAITKDKAALQLQLLSNTIMSMSSGTQETTDVNTPKERLKPISTLLLQLLSLEIRCMSWKFSGHICDDVKEMWDPLARYLANFANHFKGIEKAEFAAIYKTIVRIQAAVAVTKKRATTKLRNNLSVARIATVLGQLAQEAGCFEEASTLFMEALNPLADEKLISSATVRCRIAALHFQIPRNSTKLRQLNVSHSLSEVTTGLGTPLRGNQNDLDELLVESAKLKKLAMSWLGEKVTKDHVATDEEREIFLQIYAYMGGFVKFLRRYIGRKPAAEDEEKDHEIFHKRLDACRSIVLAAVDSAIAIGKLSVMSDSPPWDSILPSLIDSYRLLTAIDCSPQEKQKLNADDSGMGFVRMSNLFWSRYLKDKESGAGHRELLHVLKHSVSFLSSCSPSQRKTGFAALKYERLAHLYLEANMVVESGEAFRDSIKEHIDTGVLKQLLVDTSGASPYRASQEPKSNGFTLGRVLSAYLRANMRGRNSTNQKFFDCDDINPLQRGFLLEWQMGILTELPSHAHSDERFQSAFDSLMSSIFEVYSPELHPIRRLRAILSCLRFSLENPGSLGLSTIRTIVEESLRCLDKVQDIGEDTDLKSYATHLENSVRLTLGLHEGDLRSDELERILGSWSLMMRSCIDRKSLVSSVGDVDHCLLQMKAIVDYTEIYGLWKLQLTALELVLHITEIHETGDFSEAIIILSRLVMQYCRLGHCKKANALLIRADQYLSQNEVSCLASLSQKLARVEYLFETGELEKAADILSAARLLYEKNQKKQDLSSCSVMSKIAWERLVADVVLTSSRLSFAQGSVTQALFFAKLCVKLNCRIWAKVEKLSQRKQEKSLPASRSSDLDSVVNGVARLDISQSVSMANPTISYSQGAPFWPHVGSHHTGLLNLAYLSAHYGLFQDAVYYGDQALKLNRTLNGSIRLVASQAQLGSHWIFGGRIAEGQELLSAAELLAKQLESSVELVSFQMSIASLHRMQGNYHDEWQALLRADRIMGDVIVSVTADEPPLQSTISGLEEGMEKLRIRGSSRRAQPATTTTVRRTRAATVSRNTPKMASDKADANGTVSQSLLHLKSGILQRQAACSLALREFEKASRLLTDARRFAVSRDSQISLYLEESEQHLADAIRQFSTHAVYCVLPESTISLPALQSPRKATHEPGSSSTKQSTARKTRAPARGTRSRTAKTSEDSTAVLLKAGECLNNIFSAATTRGSTLDSHMASRLMSRISMLSHTTAPECSMPWLQPPANVNEIGRIGAFTRERIAIGVDKQLSEFNDPLLWPAGDSSSELEADLCSSFTEEYIEILPANWNVLSLSLSADCTEFIISRLRKDSSPFLLRLPLKRGNSEDEEDQFTFEDGQNEMQELIRLANESAHAAKLQKDRQSKKEWWRNREALDQRLGNLLQNIENVWFGGFRGIFSPTPHAEAALSRFAGSFQNILDKHLPSRRKGGRAGTPKLSLHRNVLELFVGVKDLEDQEDPEETLMDLLYFVVDILQFQGERNAYDEIDFDMMVIETLGAIRGYHEAVGREREAQRPQHTVLVLDKTLHLFPWESLPCLQGLPVCRVPSLECLRDRILQFQSTKANSVGSGFAIDCGSGTYILNPTGDLQTTQATFEADLGLLNTWTGISKREPTEEEFKESLASKSLFLYFGHGSGAQYIRGRTIRRLDRCAVTFLMGCSSGTLTEAGEYEPYGTPMNYLHAGCPALVATLWDVTDKDIDRFAKSTFEKWGLLRGQDANDRGSTLPNKSRSRAAKSSCSGPSCPVTLDEAVSKSRSACVLKYLNGAAPVIYGVPSLFLE